MNQPATQRLVTEQSLTDGAAADILEAAVLEFGSDTFAPLGAMVRTTDNAAAIQTKADSCASLGATLGIPAGTWDLGSTTITFHCSVRADAEAVFTGDGNPVVKVGNGTTNLVRATLVLPKVTRKTKNWGVAPGPGAGVINSDVGVRVDDTRSCDIVFPHVQNFSIGINLADDNGSLYNRYFIGHLDNNGINLNAAPTGAGGCANECQFHGGRYSHNSGEGTNVVGVRHISLLTGAAAGPNNMLFFGGSIEGNTPEFHILCEGSYNNFIGMRYEAAAPKVKTNGAGAYNNFITGGYGADEIAFTVTSSAKVPTLLGYLKPFRGVVGGADGGFVIQPGSSNGHPAIIILDTTGDVNGSGASAPGTRYNIKITPQQIMGKFSPANTDPGMDLQFVNGKIGFGSGAAPISQWIRQETSTALGFQGTGLCATTDATYDIGTSATQRRFRDLFMSRKVVVGTAQILNGAGTLEGVITAPIGSLYARSDGGAVTTLYVKESGAGNTGWVAK